MAAPEPWLLSSAARGQTPPSFTEPSGLALEPAHAGSLVFRLHVTGNAAHAAVRDEGVSAIETFALLHRALLDFEARRNAAIDHPLFAGIENKIPINIGTVHAGTWHSSVAESLVAEGRSSSYRGEDLDTFKAELVAEIERAAGEDPWLREHPPRVEWFSGQFAPAEVPVDAPVAQLVITAHEAVTGAPPPVVAFTAGTDMRHFILFGNTPCVVYGAGHVQVAHQTDESVPLAEVITATKTIAVAIAEWCGVDDVAEYSK